MMKTARLFLVACVVSMLGCASHEVVPSSGPRKPTAVTDVELYQKHPKKYEDLGMVVVNVPEGKGMDHRGDATLTFDAMKAAAAKLGANGLLLMAPSGSYDYLVTAGYHGTFYRVPVRGSPRSAMGKAIFVLEKD